MPCLRSVANDLRFLFTCPVDKSKKTYCSTFKLLMFIDAVGLLLIAFCTVAEAVEDWENEFCDHFFGNEKSMFFWILGAVLATSGLAAIAYNCSALERLPYLEHVGMFMLTFAPVVNTIGWYFLDTGDKLDNYTLMASELVEFIGMNFLNYSYWCDNPWTDCFVEVSGYAILSCAAILDIFVFPENIGRPVIQLRTSSINRFDVLGLIALMVVSIGKYQMHVDGISEFIYPNEQDPGDELLPLISCTTGTNDNTPRKKSSFAVTGKDYNE